MTKERFVGAGELEVMLGVGRQRVQQIVNHPSFPAPYQRLRGGAIWRERDVIKWAKARGRTVNTIE